MTQQPSDLFSRASQWLADAARSQPEALLLMAAGCALLMRTGRGSVDSVAARMSQGRYRGSARFQSATRLRDNVRDTVNETAEQVGSYAGDMAKRMGASARDYGSTVADTMGDYAETARDYAENARRTAARYAEDARRNVADASERAMEQAQTSYRTAAEAIREQPALIVGLGLVAGAAIAALFPATEVERRTLGAARERIAEAVSETGENLKEAASEAGERVRQSAAERGLDAEGLKGFAREAASTFAGAAADAVRASVSSGSDPSADQPRGGDAERRP
jgi:ElaB/YqjD/DUF883 family membrane-anchored ribosome-binding protein